MKNKLIKKFKQLLKWETYEDMLVAILRFFIVQPYYFVKNKKYKVLFKLSTYENVLIKTLQFLIKRSPIRLFSKKYAAHHPYQSASVSLISILAVFGLAGWYLFSNFYSSASAWWNDDWLYRKQLTIDSDQVAADLVNFPMLVSVTDTDLADKAQTDGDDIVFTEYQGNRLDHEIESYDSSTGELVAWVRIPELDGDQDSLYYMYYGNASADNQQKPEDVWDENYVLVQHMEEEGTGTRYDSTRNNNDGTPFYYDGDEATDSGKVNGADDFDGGDSDDQIRFDDDPTLEGMGQLTVEAWVNLDELPTTTGNPAMFIEKRHDSSPWNSYALNVRDNGGNNNLFFQVRNTTETSANLYGNTNLSADTWYYFVGTYDGADVHVYLNANNDDASSVTQSGSVFDSNSRFNLNYVGYMDGLLDEVRISKTARSTGWINTSYNNQNSPGTFLSVGSEEQGPGPVLYLPLDEGFGTTAHDESGQENDGVINNATWQGEDLCVSGKCLFFDGTDDNVIIDDFDL